jgi:hypothetical protein
MFRKTMGRSRNSRNTLDIAAIGMYNVCMFFLRTKTAALSRTSNAIDVSRTEIHR